MSFPVAVRNRYSRDFAGSRKNEGFSFAFDASAPAGPWCFIGMGSDGTWMMPVNGDAI